MKIALVTDLSRVAALLPDIPADEISIDLVVAPLATESMWPDSARARGQFIPLEAAEAGDYPPQWVSPDDPLTADLTELRQECLMGLLILDRKNWTGVSLARLHHLYTRYLRIWSKVIRAQQLDGIVFYDYPHRGFDYAIYRLARAWDIPTAIVSWTPFDDRVVLRGSIDGDPVRISQLRHGAEGALELTKRHELFSGSRPSTHSQYLTHGARRHADPKSWNAGMRGGVARYLPATLRGLKSGLRLLIKRQPTTFPKVIPSEPVGAIETLWYRTKIRYRISRCRSYYEQEQTESVPDSFVYYPLHYQPEATTLPAAGIHFDQVENIRMVASRMPSGCTLLVKEHPRQFAVTREWARWRDLKFYHDIANIPRVRLAPLEWSSEELAQSAAAVVTCTGTAGWEALRAGCRVGHFGFAWYSGAPGATRLTSVADVDRLLETGSSTQARLMLSREVDEWQEHFMDHYTFGCPNPASYSNEDENWHRQELTTTLVGYFQAN